LGRVVAKDFFVNMAAVAEAIEDIALPEQLARRQKFSWW